MLRPRPRPSPPRLGDGLGSRGRISSNGGLRTTTLVLGVLGLLILAGAATLVLGAATPPVPAAVSTQLRAGGSSLCSTLTTNASLLALVAAKYPTSSLDPSEQTANASVTQIWGEVCTSSILVTAEAQQSNVSFGTSVYIGDSNGSGNRVYSGSLFVGFSASWEAACPTASPPYPSGFACHSRVSWTGNLSTAALAGPVVSVVSDRLAPCTLVETNASLVGAVDGFYPDASLRPNESAANHTIQVIWGQLCSSLAFYEAYVAYGDSAFGLSQWSSGGGLSNESSSLTLTLFVGFDFMWHASCPAGGAEYPVGYDCEYDESWTANVSSGNWTGPNTTAISDNGLGGVPPCTGCEQPASSVSLTPWLLVLGAVVVVAAAAVVLFAYRNRTGGPPGRGFSGVQSPASEQASRNPVASDGSKATGAAPGEPVAGQDDASQPGRSLP
ncbi:MAG: hypothetical protein L3J77_02410 [Thermoplasmata archaeon]|nr:hypothetical protein [Thermoplasmata archaeon]